MKHCTAVTLRVYLTCTCYFDAIYTCSGTYLSDLTFIDEGNPDTLQGLVNFAKRKLTYGVIAEMQRYQQVGYQYRVVTSLEKFLKNLPSKEDKALYDLSLLREPRGAEKVP